jgi:hypothetical protein
MTLRKSPLSEIAGISFVKRKNNLAVYFFLYG